MSSYYFFQKKNRIPSLCLPMPMCSGLLLLKQPVWLWSTLSPRGLYPPHSGSTFLLLASLKCASSSFSSVQLLSCIRLFVTP